MCLLCSAALNGQDVAQRAHVLQLLALIEHPAALPPRAALRIAQELLVLTQVHGGGFRCEAIAPPNAESEETANGRLT